MAITHGTLSYAAVVASGTRHAANATEKAESTGFFSLPRELRDEIYDMLHKMLSEHQHEAKLEQLTFCFNFHLVHPRLICRRFKPEYDMRTPVTRHARLVVSPNSMEPHWYTDTQPCRLPGLPLLGQRTLLAQLEFKYNVSDQYQDYYDELLSFDEYSRWIECLVNIDPRLVKSTDGGDLHLQLSFKYVSNLGRLVRLISSIDWYDEYFTRISLVLHGVQLFTPTMEKLGLNIYTKRPQTLAVWTEGSDWKTEPAAVKQSRVEFMAGHDPFRKETLTEEEPEVNIDEVDWVAFEDGDYDGMEGSGWDTCEATTETSPAQSDSDDEVTSGLEEPSSWEASNPTIGVPISECSVGTMG